MVAIVLSNLQISSRCDQLSYCCPFSDLGSIQEHSLNLVVMPFYSPLIFNKSSVFVFDDYNLFEAHRSFILQPVSQWFCMLMSTHKIIQSFTFQSLFFDSGVAEFPWVFSSVKLAPWLCLVLGGYIFFPWTTGSQSRLYVDVT